MAANGKNAVSKAQNEVHRRVLQQLLKHDDNRSGIHRSLGVDVSKVRSTTLDTWLPEQVSFIQSMGNRKANLFWEGKMSKDFRRPSEGDMSALRHFIDDKYREGMYALRTWDKPPTIETYLVHPFMKQFDGESSDASAQEGSAKDNTQRDKVPPSKPPSAQSSRALGKVVDVGNLKVPEPVKLPSESSRQKSAAPSQPPVSQQLFDLLSLEEPQSAPSPSVENVLLGSKVASPSRSNPAASHVHTLSQDSFGGADKADVGWAAFEEQSAVTAPETTAAAEPADDGWDAFQGDDSAANPVDAATDPFQTGNQGSGLHEAEFSPKLPSAPNLDKVSNAQRPPTSGQHVPKATQSHRSQKSMEEIMAMFDPPSTSKGSFGSARSTPTAGVNLFQADFPPVNLGSDMNNIALPADFWSPDFKAPQAASAMSLPGPGKQPQSFHAANSQPNLNLDDWAAFAQK